MRKSTLMLAVMTAAALACAGLFVVHPLWNRPAHDDTVSNSRLAVRRLGLTDLCLFTEARYARHLSQSDRHAAFQDHPLALEYLPSGSMVSPPAHLRRERNPGNDRQQRIGSGHEVDSTATVFHGLHPRVHVAP